MADPGHLPAVPHHLSSRSPGRNAYPPPLPTRKPHQQQPQQQQAAASFHPPPPSSAYPHQQQPLQSEIQPALVTAEEASHKAVKYKKPWGSGAENVGINVEPEANQNQTDDSDFDDDSFSSSSSSHSSLVSNAPSVEHFNISFIFKKTFREHEGARAFHSMRSILKVVYMCSLRWTYNILLFTIGILVTFLWAVINGAIAFLQAWVLSPLTRVSLVVVKGILPVILDPLSLILKACAQGCGGGCAGLSAAQHLQGGLQSVTAFRQKLEV